MWDGGGPQNGGLGCSDPEGLVQNKRKRTGQGSLQPCGSGMWAQLAIPGHL